MPQVVARVFLLLILAPLCAKLGCPMAIFFENTVLEFTLGNAEPTNQNLQKRFVKKDTSPKLCLASIEQIASCPNQHVTVISSHIPSCFGKFVNSVNSEAEINVLQIWHVRHMVNAYWLPPGRGLSCVRELRGVLFGFVARLVAAAWTQRLGKVQRKQEMKDNGRLEISQCGSFHSCHSCFKDFLSLVCCLLLDKVQNLLVESSSSAKLHVSKAVSGKYIPENPEVSMCASTYLFLMMKVLIN